MSDKQKKLRPVPPTQEPEFQRRLLVMRRARLRLTKALIERGIGMDAGDAAGADFCLVNGRHVLTYRGLRQIWLRTFPKRRGKSFQFKLPPGKSGGWR